MPFARPSFRTLLLGLLLGGSLAGCAGDDDAPPPPPKVRATATPAPVLPCVAADLTLVARPETLLVGAVVIELGAEVRRKCVVEDVFDIDFGQDASHPRMDVPQQEWDRGFHPLVRLEWRSWCESAPTVPVILDLVHIKNRTSVALTPPTCRDALAFAQCPTPVARASGSICSILRSDVHWFEYVNGVWEARPGSPYP